MEEKLKVFEVCICQSFDYHYYEYSWLKKILKTDRYDACGKNRYILAKSDTEAIEIYKKRYKCEYTHPVESLWQYSAVGFNVETWISESPNFEHNVVAIERHPSFEKLKNELRAEELLAFCKQEMYPIEVLTK